MCETFEIKFEFTKDQRVKQDMVAFGAYVEFNLQIDKFMIREELKLAWGDVSTISLGVCSFDQLHLHSHGT